MTKLIIWPLWSWCFLWRGAHLPCGAEDIVAHLGERVPDLVAAASVVRLHIQIQIQMQIQIQIQIQGLVCNKRVEEVQVQGSGTSCFPAHREDRSGVFCPVFWHNYCATSTKQGRIASFWHWSCCSRMRNKDQWQKTPILPSDTHF